MSRARILSSLVALPVVVGLLLMAALSTGVPVLAAVKDADDSYGFDDSPRAEVLSYPDWFNDPFLDLRADLNAAREAGKGLILYFGQKRCAYCHRLIDLNFGSETDIVEYTRRHFDVTPIDIWGVAELTDLTGQTLTEREFASREQAEFTPTLIFYDDHGQEVLRLRGYYPPYQFRAALEYVADEHYRRETFRDYLARGDNRMVFDASDLNDQPFFQPPPFNLDRSRLPGERPLAVFFEQGDCHPCDVLHGQSLQEPAIRSEFLGFDSVQLDMWSQTPVITPAGKRTTARDWAADLGLFYAPALIFFDEQGREILRLDSVVGFYRLRNVVNYIASRAYQLEPSYQRWRQRQPL